MIELREISEAWGYSDKLLKKSEDIHDILVTLLINCRVYYNIMCMDSPRFLISINGKELNLDCDNIFCKLNNDEKVIEYVKNWYEKII